MAVKNMTRTDFDKSAKGGIFHETITIDAGTLSDVFIMPFFYFSAIAASITGDGILQFTNDPPSVIEQDNADWEDWDGISLINHGLVAFRVERTTGTVVVKVTLRTPVV